jgi:hypothetical protein
MHGLARLALVPFALAHALTFAQSPAPARPAATGTPPGLTVRIVNAQTNKPVANERLNLSFHPEEIGYRTLPTDKAGLVHLDPAPTDTVVRILTNFYADCRPRAELFTNYSLATLRSAGISTGNLCSAAHPNSKPGELVLFVIPKNAIRTMGQPPASNLPHSDENPHTNTDNPFAPAPINPPPPSDPSPAPPPRP